MIGYFTYLLIGGLAVFLSNLATLLAILAYYDGHRKAKRRISRKKR